MMVYFHLFYERKDNKDNIIWIVNKRLGEYGPQVIDWI